MAFLGSGDGPLGLVHLQAQAPFDELGHARHHPLPRTFAAHVHVAVVRIANEPVATPGELSVELVQHDVGEQRRQRDRLAERPARCRSPHRPAAPPWPSASVRSARAAADRRLAARASRSAAGGRRDRRISPDQDPRTTRSRPPDAALPRRLPCGSFGQVETRGSRDGMSAPTAVRAPAARPPGPPYRPRRESPARADRPLPWECTPGGSRRADTSPAAGRLAARAARPATAQAASRSSARPDRERPCSTPPSTTHPSIAAQPPPSSPSLPSPSCRSPSALPPGSPPAGPGFSCGWPLSGFLLSRSAGRAAPPFLRPGPPSLARRGSTRRAQRALPRLPVLLGPRTSAGPSAFVLSFYGLPATSPEPSRSPGVKR